MTPELGISITRALLRPIASQPERDDVRGLVAFEPGTLHALSLSFSNVGNIPTDYKVIAWFGSSAAPAAPVTPSAWATALHVAPFASGTVSITLLAPVLDGSYPVMVQVYGEPSGQYVPGSPQWTSALQSLYANPVQVDTLTVTVRVAATVSGSTSGTVADGSLYPITFTIRNTGNVAMQAQLVARQVDAAGAQVGYVKLSQVLSLEAGVSVTSANLSLLAPSEPGVYTIRGYVTGAQLVPGGVAGQLVQVSDEVTLGTSTVAPRLGVGPILSVGWA